VHNKSLHYDVWKLEMAWNGTNRKPVCDLLLVINSNSHPISYRFGVIAACSNFASTLSL